MNLFGRVKQVEVTVFDKARKAVLGVESALSIFSHLIAEINQANNDLTSVVTDCEKVIAEHQDLKVNAEKSIEEYKALLENIGKLVTTNINENGGNTNGK